jgi:hypothetical protein
LVDKAQKFRTCCAIWANGSIGIKSKQACCGEGA